MSWMATARFEARSAPAGLALVQELVNTHAVERDGADLLADHATTQQWLEEASRQWAGERGLKPPDPALSETDLQALRELRASVQDMLAIPPDERPTDPVAVPSAVTHRAQVYLVTDEQNRVAMVPVGAGAGWLASAIWSEILLAQRTGTWSRLKLCREPGCVSAFYDASRNGSGVWHNVRSCGNIANLRASRTRKKKHSAADGTVTSAGNVASTN
ncbi:putative RNA-binding Zn ribbon-like protein [Kribbella orskensis]|uniref:RNA-binding Zn ribbon-like protein n=1 Tax=Kribbella orskensis TaxID=2512216 RepID=A0ABY2BJC3_9ACTN|nr:MULTISPECIES: CGNR zinc finger domain-containing protein [Kribbella]TCN40077.1 putative RNA-binding Zn ribbon-like protein [Kribbella sp. VKM Ac-2500]TCO22697.1 putative RNA-binding Zn ribbon-like protein [Kribbella orskensis]